MPDEVVSLNDVRQELLSQILEAAKESASLGSPVRERVLHDLAEAWAWVHSPSQPHGGASALASE
jgi:hypothetical protein